VIYLLQVNDIPKNVKQKEVINMIYGYARVSTKDQNLERQISSLENQGCEVIFKDKMTGSKRNRPELDKLLEIVQEGDTVIVHELSRFSRSTKDLLSLVSLLSEKGVGFKSVKESWINTAEDSAVGQLMLTIFSGIAEFERKQINERINEGLEIAKSKGRVGGRPRKTGDNMHYAIQLYKEGEKSISEICRITKVSRPTFYRRLKEQGLK
jgi:DNA invertase Pin-like site-specific DNA recombinase